jgi:hypothetical protein
VSPATSLQHRAAGRVVEPQTMTAPAAGEDPPQPSGSRPTDRPQVAVRASDADREQVADQLREAAGDGRITLDELDERLHRAYLTRTRAELAPLTADLALDVTPAGTPAVPASPGDGGTHWVVSVMGGHDRSGRWRVAPRCNVINVMGGSDLDLTHAELSAPVTTITMVSIMGGGEIRVPDGVEVSVSKVGLMGGNDVVLSDQPVAPGAPVVRIRLIAIMGGNSVEQGPKKTRAEKREERRLRKAARRGEIGRGPGDGSQ